MDNNRHHHTHKIDAKEIWGVDFFWSENLKIDERELKKVTKKVMHP